MRAPRRDVVKWRPKLDQPISLASLKEAAQFMGYVVEKYGEVYRPILNRLNAELEAMREKPAPDAVPMPRTAAKVTQADIARAIRAMRASGYPDVRVVLKDDAVIVEAASPGSKPPPDPMRIVPL